MPNRRVLRRLALLTSIFATAALSVVPGTANAALQEVAMSTSFSVANGSMGTYAPLNVATTIDLNVQGAGQGSITNAVAKVTMPAGLTLGALPAGCSYAAPVLTCVIGNMGMYGSVSKSVPVTPTTVGHHLMTASFTHDELDFYQPYVSSVDLEAISATGVRIGMNGPTPQTIRAGSPQTIFAQDVLYNQGPAAATNAKLMWTLPAGWTWNSSTPAGGGSCANTTVNGRTRITCTWASLAANTNTGVNLSVTPNATGTADHDIQISTSSADYDTSDNSKVVTWNVLPATATNMYVTGGINGGSPYTKNVNIPAYFNFGNFGPGSATGAVLTISGNLPGVTFTSVTVNTDAGVTCNGAGTGTLTCSPASGTFASTKYGQVLFNVTPGAAGPFTLTGTMTANEVDSVTTGGNTAMTRSDSIVIRDTAHADISTFVGFENNFGDVASFAPGQSATIQSSISNSGPAAAAGTQMVVTIPSNANYVSHNGTASCVRNLQVFTCNIGSLAANDSRTLNVVVTAGAVGNGTAQASGSTSTTQTSTQWDTGQALWRVHNNDAELDTSVTYTPSVVKLGDQVRFRIAVSNAQVYPYALDAAATGVVVRDNLPSGWTAVAAESAGASSCTVDATGATCNRASLLKDATMIMYVTATANGTTGSKLNDVVVTTTSTDLNPANNNEQTPLTVQGAATADLALDLTYVQSPISPGAAYAVHGTVRNNGGATATGVNAVFTLPAGDTLATGSIAGGACSGTGTVTCSIASMDAGATFNFVLSVTARATPGSLNLVGTTSSSVSDPSTSNNSETAAISVLAPGIDLASSFAIPNGQPTTVVLGGQQAVWEARIRNNGGSTATNVQVTLTVPNNVVSAFANTCSGAAPTLTCTIPSLPANSVYAFTLQVVPGAAGALTVSMNATSGAAESDTGNNSASNSDVTVAAPNTADLSLANHGNPAAVAANLNTTVRFDVDNDGGNATDTHVTATLPAGLQYVGSTASQGVGSCAFDAGTRVVDCNLGLVTGSGTPFVTITVKSSTPGGYAIPASVASATSDPDTTNNAASADATILGSGADVLVHSVTTAGDTFNIGDEIDYLIEVRNNGPQANSATVTATIPAGSTFDEASTTNGTCDGAPSLGVLTCSLGAISSGGVVHVHVVVKTTASSAKSLVAAVTGNAAVTDDVLTNNSKSKTVTFVGPVVEASGSLAFPEQLIGTASAAQSLTVKNTGGSAATLNSVDLGGDHAGDFSRTVTCGATIAASATCQVDVQFTPTAVGARSATLSIASSDPTSPLVLTVTGTGRAATTVAVVPTVPDSDGDGLNDGVDCAPADPKRPAAGGDKDCDGIPNNREPIRYTGNKGPNRVIGSLVADIIRGMGGNDTLDGRAGADKLFGDAGNDTLIGGPGKDMLSGGAGNDTLTGNDNPDQLIGGLGNDRINAKDGKPGDVVNCGAGRDQVIADKGDKLAKDCEARVARFGR